MLEKCRLLNLRGKLPRDKVVHNHIAMLAQLLDLANEQALKLHVALAHKQVAANLRPQSDAVEVDGVHVAICGGGRMHTPVYGLCKRIPSHLYKGTHCLVQGGPIKPTLWRIQGGSHAHSMVCMHALLCCRTA